MSYWYGKVAKIYLKKRAETYVSVFKKLKVSCDPLMTSDEGCLAGDSVVLQTR